MPKLNIYEQQYRASSPRATGEQFGASAAREQGRIGAAISGAGEAIADIGQKRQARLDGINTAMAFEQYKAAMDEEFTTTKANSNFADQKVLQGYTQRAQELASETLSNFEGSADARNRLAMMLEQQRGSYARGGYEEHVAEGYRIVGQFAENKVDSISRVAAGSPEMLSEHISSWMNEFEVLRDALPPEMEQQFFDAGVSKIAQSVYGSYMDTGNFEAALSVLDQPGVAQAMGGDMNRQLRMEARSLQYDATKKQREAQTNIDLYTRFTGQAPTNAQVAQMFGMHVSNPQTTPGQKIRDITKELGITAESNPAMYQRVIEGVYDLDLSGDEIGGQYGKSQTGLAYADMSRLYGLNDRGMMSVDDKRRFIESAHMYQKSGARDETGAFRTLPLPPHFERLRDSFAKELGIDTGSATTVPSPGNVSASVVQVEPESIEAQAINLSNDPIPDKTVMDVLDLVTGPSSSIQSGLEGFFATEGLVSGEEERVYRQWLQGVERSLVGALRQNPKFSEGERMSLEKEINLSGSLTQGGSGFATTVAGVDKSIQDRIREANGFLEDPGSTVEMKKYARDVLPVLYATREKLGVIVVKSDQDLMKLYESGKLRDGQVLFDSNYQTFVFRESMMNQGGNNGE